MARQSKAMRALQTIWMRESEAVIERTRAERHGTVTNVALDNASLVCSKVGDQYAVSVLGTARDTQFCATCVSDSWLDCLHDLQGFLMANFKVCHWNDLE